MLQKAWNKVVYGYQSVRQSMDKNDIAVLDRQIAEAREGYQTYTGPAPIYAYVPDRIKLTPAEAAEAITEFEGERVRLVTAMTARREKYGLKP